VFDLYIDLQHWQLIAGIVFVFLASIVRGFTGFGFSALAVTTLSLITAPKEIVPVIFILEIIASLHLLPSTFGHVDKKFLFPLTLGVVICTPLGVLLLVHLSEESMRLILYPMVMIIAILLSMGGKQKRPQPALPYIGGLVSGFANGAAAIGGLPVVLLMLYVGVSATALRATLIAFFAFTDIYGLAWAGHQSLLTDQVLSLVVIFVFPMVLGIAMGSAFFKRTSNADFRWLTLSLLIAVSGLGLIRSAVTIFGS